MYGGVNENGIGRIDFIAAFFTKGVIYENGYNVPYSIATTSSTPPITLTIPVLRTKIHSKQQNRASDLNGAPPQKYLKHFGILPTYVISCTSQLEMDEDNNPPTKPSHMCGTVVTSEDEEIS